LYRNAVWAGYIYMSGFLPAKQAEAPKRLRETPTLFIKFVT
jgi:hypothetical protein